MPSGNHCYIAIEKDHALGEGEYLRGYQRDTRLWSQTKLLKMAIEIVSFPMAWWFSIVMLVYQMVFTNVFPENHPVM